MHQHSRAPPHTDQQISLQTIIISRFILNLRRSQMQPAAPSRASGFRSSIFHLPTIPVIAEDMGRPLDYGVREDNEEIVEELHDDSTATSVAQVRSPLRALTEDSGAGGSASSSSTMNHTVC